MRIAGIRYTIEDQVIAGALTCRKPTASLGTVRGFEYIIMVVRDRRDVWWATAVDWTRTRTRKLWRIARQRKQRDCTTVGVCVQKKIKRN